MAVQGLRAYSTGELRNKLGLDLHAGKFRRGRSNVSVTERDSLDPGGRLREGVIRSDRLTGTRGA